MKRPTDRQLGSSRINRCRSSQKTNNLMVSTLNVDSNLRLPSLKELIEDWKQTTCAKRYQLKDEHLTVLGSNLQLNEYVQYLTNKVTSLEASLKEMTRRHIEVCTVLQNQMQKRQNRNENLLRENSDLKVELNEMIEKVRTIANELNIKSQSKHNFKRPFTSNNLNKLKSKENRIPQTKELRSHHHIHQSKSLPRTQLSKVKLKTSSSLLKQKRNEAYEEQKQKKQHNIKEEYYSKSDHRVNQKLFRERNGPSKSFYQ